MDVNMTNSDNVLVLRRDGSEYSESGLWERVAHAEEINLRFHATEICKVIVAPRVEQLLWFNSDTCSKTDRCRICNGDIFPPPQCKNSLLSLLSPR